MTKNILHDTNSLYLEVARALEGIQFPQFGKSEILNPEKLCPTQLTIKPELDVRAPACQTIPPLHFPLF